MEAEWKQVNGDGFGRFVAGVVFSVLPVIYLVLYLVWYDCVES